MNPKLTSKKAYHQAPEENELNYNKFCTFRNFGPDRNIEDAYGLYCFNLKKQKDINELTEWEQLAMTFDWQARALIFDADQSLLKQEKFEAKQSALVEKYREDTVELGQLQVDISRKAYELIMVKLQNITPQAALKLEYRDMNEMGKMAIQLTDAGLINLHNGLSIDDILKKVGMMKEKGSKGSNVVNMKKAR